MLVFQTHIKCIPVLCLSFYFSLTGLLHVMANKGAEDSATYRVRVFQGSVFSVFFFWTMRGPTLSPVSALCLA